MTTAVPLRVRAAVSDGHSRTRVEELDLRGAQGWLRVESSAICGTDVQLHAGGLRAPAVLGHHVIGTIDHLSDELIQALGISPGARVAVEEYVGCGMCADCRRRDYRFCAQADLWSGGQRVGMLPASLGTGLHGGNAQYLELTSRHVAHRVPDSIARDLASWTLPLANALDWTVDAGGAQAGARVGIIGPGYHGLACVAAARAAGARHVEVYGLERDADRLELAEILGGRPIVVTRGTATRPRPAEEGLDVIVDTAGTSESLALAAHQAKRFATIVVAGLHGTELSIDAQLIRQQLTIRGVRGRSPQAVRRSIELLRRGVEGLSDIPTHHVALEEVGDTLNSMRDGLGPSTPHVVVDPWGEHALATAAARAQEVSS